MWRGGAGGTLALEGRIASLRNKMEAGETDAALRRNLQEPWSWGIPWRKGLRNMIF